MPNRQDKKGRSKTERWFTVYHYVMRSMAFRSLTTQARAIFFELMLLYNGSNNGRIGLSCRQASDQCNMAKDTAMRAFQELIDKELYRVYQARRVGKPKQAVARVAAHAHEMRPDRTLGHQGLHGLGENPSVPKYCRICPKRRTQGVWRGVETASCGSRLGQMSPKTSLRLSPVWDAHSIPVGVLPTPRAVGYRPRRTATRLPSTNDRRMFVDHRHAAWRWSIRFAMRRGNPEARGPPPNLRAVRGRRCRVFHIATTGAPHAPSRYRYKEGSITPHPDEIQNIESRRLVASGETELGKVLPIGRGSTRVHPRLIGIPRASPPAPVARIADDSGVDTLWDEQPSDRDEDETSPHASAPCRAAHIDAGRRGAPAAISTGGRGSFRTERPMRWGGSPQIRYRR